MNISTPVMTGNICSGKSLCSDYLAGKGYMMIDGDDIVKEGLKKGGYLYDAYVDILGRGILNEEGDINKKTVRKAIFTDISHKKRIERVAHPFVMENFIRIAGRNFRRRTMLVFPLVFELEMEIVFEHIILIYCRDGTRARRLMLRDNIDADYAGLIMSRQACQDKKVACSNIVIDNSHDREFTYLQLKGLMGMY